MRKALVSVVETRGIEPLTPALPMRIEFDGRVTRTGHDSSACSAAERVDRSVRHVCGTCRSRGLRLPQLDYIAFGVADPSEPSGAGFGGDFTLDRDPRGAQLFDHRRQI